MPDKTLIKYTPSRFNTILSVIVFCLATIVFVFFFKNFDNCILEKVVHCFSESQKHRCAKITHGELITFCLYIFFFLIYISICIILLIIVLKDDGGIRFAKLNELARFHEEIKSLTDEFIEADNNEREEMNDKTNVTHKSIKKINAKLEIYKKYMDTIAEI